MPSFFTLSKVLGFIATPSNVAVLLAVLALLTFRWRGLSLGLLGAAVAVLLVFGFSPAPNYILSPLEERFPQFHDDGRPVTGIMVLGGAEVPGVGIPRNAPAFNDAGERVMAFADLARRYPQARLAFIGGSGNLWEKPGQELESRMMQLALGPLGIDPARVEFEKRSRNTGENAAFAKAMLKPGPGERWLLITSAFHMPRAVGCFRAVGFEVVPYPVDFRTAGPDRLWDSFSNAATGLDFTDISVREWIGLVAYYLAGRTPVLFPAPEAAR